MGHNFPPTPPSRTSWDEFARWYTILTDPAAVAQAYIDFPETNPAGGAGLEISPDAAAIQFSAPLNGSPSPNFYPATMLHWAAPLLSLSTRTSDASGILTAADSGGGGPVTLPFTWRGVVLQGGIDPTDPPPPPVCIELDEYFCYSRMGRGDTYTPAINQADSSLHDIDSGGFRTDSWIELGVGGGAATATIDFDPDLELGDGTTSVGVALGIQFAIKPTTTFAASFELMWKLDGNFTVSLYARTNGGVNEYEWRISGTTVVATPKVDLAQNGWTVLGILVEVFHLSCEVASATCSGAPFGFNNETIVKITDLATLASGVQSFGASTTNSIDGMTFSSGSVDVGYACTVLGFTRTGIVLSEITVPANCLDFIGNVCTVPVEGTCVDFEPQRCIECFTDDRGIPPRVKSGPSPTIIITPDPTEDRVIVFDDLLGVEATLAAVDGIPFEPTFRLSPDGFPIQQDPDAPEVELTTNPLAIPVTLSDEGPPLDVPPDCPGTGDTGPARDDGIPYIP